MNVPWATWISPCLHTQPPFEHAAAAVSQAASPARFLQDGCSRAGNHVSDFEYCR